MADLIGSAGDVSMALQTRNPLQGSSGTAIKKLIGATDTDSKASTQLDDKAAREAAEKFEALLIHSMLKNMRKTTMTENKSNDRAIYDDMLDEKLADTMIEAGGIGIADQIVAQIREQQGRPIDSPSTDKARLRELAKNIERPSAAAISVETKAELAPQQATTDITHLRLATGLWGSKQESTLSTRQQEFVEPLIPHARRNAQKLGTSADAILAIAALETGWGRSMIKDDQGNNSHNLFGIKATGSDNRYATTLTTEYIEGSPQKMQARFKTFEDSADAVNGFADFILTNPRYSNALEHAGNPEKFLTELQVAGYATDPRYAEKAISIMRQIAGNRLPL